jgi:hypothetical protein
MALTNRSRNGVAVSADFEKPSSPPPRKAAPVLKSKSLTCFKFRFLRRPLDELYENDVGGLKKEWGEARKIRWSKFNSAQYEATVLAIRTAMGGEPLWKVESYWRGYQ